MRSDKSLIEIMDDSLFPKDRRFRTASIHAIGEEDTKPIRYSLSSR